MKPKGHDRHKSYDMLLRVVAFMFNQSNKSGMSSRLRIA
jgi:hypothetical protein